MKKIWKALGIAALAAAVVPYRVHKDDETGAKTIEALLWQVTRGPGEEESKEQIDVTLGFKSPFQAVREEKELFTDNPEEAVLFADDEPEAAVVDVSGLEEAQAGAEPEAAEAEKPAEPIAEEPTEPASDEVTEPTADEAAEETAEPAAEEPTDPEA